MNMKLHLYLWSEHYPEGNYIISFDSWQHIGWFMDHWKHPDKVFTVIVEEE